MLDAPVLYFIHVDWSPWFMILSKCVSMEYARRSRWMMCVIPFPYPHIHLSLYDMLAYQALFLLLLIIYTSINVRIIPSSFVTSGWLHDTLIHSVTLSSRLMAPRIRSRVRRSAIVCSLKFRRRPCTQGVICSRKPTMCHCAPVRSQGSCEGH